MVVLALTQSISAKIVLGKVHAYVDPAEERVDIIIQAVLTRSAKPVQVTVL